MTTDDTTCGGQAASIWQPDTRGERVSSKPMKPKLHQLRVLVLFLLWLDSGRSTRAQSLDAYLDNSTVKVGVNSGTYGGAIVWLSGSDGANLVNIHDKGREIQQSYYAGKSITAANQSSSWSPWSWNPIMVGDYAGHVSPVLALNKNSGQIYVKTQPMLWDRNNQVSQSYMEQWISLHPTLNNVVAVDCRLSCFRDNNDAWGGPVVHNQELPAVYLVSALNTIMAYTGGSPWTGDALATIPNSPASGTFPWSRYTPTEPWTACVNSTNTGAGVYTPDATSFLAGKSGSAVTTSPTDASTMYIAPIANQSFNYNSVYSYRFYLIVGSLATIRDSVYFLSSQAATPPLAPTGLTANPGYRQVDLTWNPSANATGYQIRRSSSSGGPFALMASVTATNYSDTSLPNGVTYYYVVSSINSVGEGAGSQTVAGTAAGLITVPNSGFETPVISTYQYNPGGGSWTFNSSSGISRNSSAFTKNNPAAPEGTQVAFVQGGNGSFSQLLYGFIPGATYRITFSAAQRSGYVGQTWNATINGTIIGSFAPPQSATSYIDYSATFTASSGNQTLAFVGTNLNGGDNTVFIDNVRVSVTDIPYAVWLGGFSFAAGADQTPTGNPVADGIPNLCKYALGLDPLAPAVFPFQPNRVAVGANTFLQLSVTRDPLATQVLIEGLSAATLNDPAAWSTSTTVIEDNTPTLFRVRDALPIETTNMRFLKLRFTLQP